MSDMTIETKASSELGSRLWAASKISAASMAGPAGTVVGSALLAAAAYASGMAVSPEAMEQFRTPQAIPAIIGAMGVGLGSLAMIPAAAIGFSAGFRGEAEPGRPGLKEALTDAWRSVRDHAIYGAGAIGVAATASGLRVFMEPGVDPLVSSIVGVVGVPALLATFVASAAAVTVPSERSAESALAAAGDAASIRDREVRLLHESQSADAPGILSRLSSKLAGRRQGSDPGPSASGAKPGA